MDTKDQAIEQEIQDEHMHKQMDSHGGGVAVTEGEMEDEDEQEEDSRRGNIVRGAWTMVLVVLCVGGYFVWKFATTPSVGTITSSGNAATLKATQSKEGEIEDSEDKVFNGKYVSFSYDKSYIMKSHEDLTQKKEGIIETAYFTQPSINSSKIAITIENMTGKTMDDLSSYVLRKSKPDVYKPSKYDFGSVKGLTFSSLQEGKYERLYYISNGKYMAELALSSTKPETKELDKEAEKLARVLKFKN